MGNPPAAESIPARVLARIRERFREKDAESNDIEDGHCVRNADSAVVIGVLGFDDGSMAYRERTQLSSLQHLEKNPKVVVLYRDHQRDIGWKFRCTAAVHAEGSVYQQVMDRLAESGLIQDPEAEGVAVVLQIDQISTLFGDVLQERVPNLRW